MLIQPQPFANTAIEGLKDEREIALLEIQKQLLKRVHHFGPGMVPCVHFKKAFLEFDILDHILWMLKRKIKFKALHREDAAHAVIHCGKRREMSRVIHSP